MGKNDFIWHQAMGLDEACGALWLSVSPESSAKIEAHLLWNTLTMTRAIEESKDLEDLDANDFGRCFFALSMTLIQGDPENIVAKTQKLAFVHYCLNVNDLVSRGLPGRQALTLALDSTGDRYLENNPWFQRLLQALRDADSSPSSEDSSQIAEQLMREILDDITADEPDANLF